MYRDHEYPTNFYIRRSVALISSVLGAVYALWLIYAAGLNYLLMAVIFMALGIPVFVWARKQNSPRESVFSLGERFAAGILVVGALFALYTMITGVVSV